MRIFGARHFTSQEIQGAMFINRCHPGKAINWLRSKPTSSEITEAARHFGERFTKDKKRLREYCVRQRRIRATLQYKVRKAEECGFITPELMNQIVGPSPEFGSGVRLR